ncbi:MAG: GNAT family N-acetyltransferase [Candidatus Aenigmarchaeota archaeon]|nr:GNAT family N-acetyltransferase [Candidatus Aenigmarchaeota archaeon]
MVTRFIPPNFKIPELLETDRFRLRMLTVNDVKKDYDAVITSIEHLQETKPFGSTHKWPTEDLTYEQDLIDLEWHQKEFQKRASFAYIVMNLDETECLGCTYIYPSDTPNYDAMIMMWVRQSEVANGLDGLLFFSVKKWIHDKWPFEKVAYPGREIGWDGVE